MYDLIINIYKREGELICMSKKLLVLFFMVSILITLTSCSGVTKEEYEEVSTTLQSTQDENAKLQSQVDTLVQRYTSLNDDYTELKTKYDEYEAIIEPYKDLSEAELLAKTNEANLKAKEDQKALEKLEAEEAAKEAEAAAAKEAEEKLGYETGITFNQLARNPDDYLLKKVKFTGAVIQVIEGDGTTTQIRLAVNSDYDKIILVEYDSSIVSSRILDDDIITVYGQSFGLISYQSTLGGTITIPSVYADKIDQ